VNNNICFHILLVITHTAVTLNEEPSNQIFYNGDEVLFLPLFQAVTVVVFGVNRTLCGQDLVNVDWNDHGSVNSSQLRNIPFQKLVVRPGSNFEY